MNTFAVAPNFPLQITFRNVKRPPISNSWIRLEAAKLEEFYGRIMGCRVAIERPRCREEGRPYHVRIDLTVPGGELVIRQQPTLKTRARQVGEAQVRKRLEVASQYKHFHRAIHDAFKAAGRRLQDYARRQRGDIKHREVPSIAKVTQIFRDKGYGFLATPEGAEIYFHKESVLNRGFNRLKTGTIVSFAEEQGEKGPQASSIRIAAKQRGLHVRQTPTSRLKSIA